MKALIYEPFCDGHRLNFVAQLLAPLRQAGIRVVVALHQGAMEREEFRVHLSRWQSDVEMDVSLEPIADGRALSTAASVSRLHRSVERNRPSHLYVPSADGLAQAIGLRQWTKRQSFPPDLHREALLLRGTFAYPPAGTGRGKRWMNQWKNDLSFRLASAGAWNTLFHLDPLVCQAAKHRGLDWIKLMPDPVEKPSGRSRTEVLSALGVPLDGQYIGTAGLLSDRKGVPELLAAFCHADRERWLDSSQRLLLAGKQEDSIRRLLETTYRDVVSRGRIIVVDRVLDDAAFVDAIGAMDVVAAPYPRHIGSASIVIRAAAAGRPVLGSTFGWIGWVVPTFGLGQSIDVNQVESFAKALADSLQASPEFTLTEGGRRFVAYHTPENYGATFARKAIQASGSDVALITRSWDWVLEAVPSRLSSGLSSRTGDAAT